MRLPARYEATGATNSGGMGDIHECRDTHLHRRVVLKMLKDGEDSRRLLDEQKALIKIRSKHVVQLFDVISVEVGSAQKTALVLEHIDGHDLAVGSYKPDKAYLKTVWQIACGLLEIHQNGIIHRDIKPSNIRVDGSGVVKILDFGLARTSGFEAQTRSVIGTPGFMAPELWGATTVSFDQAIDVYAFGVLCLALISSSAPDELMRHPPSALPTGALDVLKGDLPNDVVAVIEKCLSYQPANRPSIEEVENTLRPHLLKGRHRALLVLNGKTYEINMKAPSATVKNGETDAIGIAYNGLTFSISSSKGTVGINNKNLTVGDVLPDCCVIAFGVKGARTFATFDVSNPEVMP